MIVKYTIANCLITYCFFVIIKNTPKLNNPNRMYGIDFFREYKLYSDNADDINSIK